MFKMKKTKVFIGLALMIVVIAMVVIGCSDALTRGNAGSKGQNDVGSVLALKE